MTHLDWPLISTIAAPIIAALVVIIYLPLRLSSKKQLDQHLTLLQQIEIQRHEIYRLLQDQIREQHEQRSKFDQHQVQSLLTLQESLQKAMKEVREQMQYTLTQQSLALNSSIDKLTQHTQERLREISGHVDRRLAEGFEKTTATFTDVIKRLTIIDEAQKGLQNYPVMVSLQEVLNDKRTRGAFGEVQLSALLHNVIPETHFKLQHTLSNGKRVDCLLLLPEPTGNMAIDAKFPLESYKQLTKLI